MLALDELFGGVEQEMREKAKMEIAAEKAAWDALTPEEQEAAVAAAEAKFGNSDDKEENPEPCAGCGDPDCDFDCDGPYEE